jgi:hypothetical protein
VGGREKKTDKNQSGEGLWGGRGVWEVSSGMEQLFHTQNTNIMCVYVFLSFFITMVSLQYKSKDIEETNLDGSLRIGYIHHHWTGGEDEEREKQKRKRKLDEDESQDLVTLPVMIARKEDIWLFLFLQRLGTTSTLLHQLMHLSCITGILLAVGPPGFTKGG